MRSWFVFSLLIVLLGSCLEEADCIRTSGTTLRIQFKKKSNGTDTTLSIKQIMVVGTDSVFYSPADEVDDLSAVSIAINPFADTSHMIFEFGDDSNAEMTVGYSRSTHLISKDCGSETQITNLKIISSDFDSTQVIKTTFTRAIATQIEIFR